MKIFITITIIGIMFCLQNDKIKNELSLNRQESVAPTVIRETILASPEKKIDLLGVKNKNDLTKEQLLLEIKRIELRLSVFADLSFEQFTKTELDEFNSLMQKKAIFLKKYIFKKYASFNYLGKL